MTAGWSRERSSLRNFQEVGKNWQMIVSVSIDRGMLGEDQCTIERALHTDTVRR